MLPRRFAWALLCLLVFAFLSSASGAASGKSSGGEWTQDGPTLSGFVTRVTSANDFDVDGTKVVVEAGTGFSLSSTGRENSGSIASRPQTPYLGQFCMIFGKADRKAHSVAAKEVRLVAPADGRVSGTGIIDQVLAGSGNVRRIQADGRVLEVAATMLVTPTGQATAKAAAGGDDLRTNVWVDYKGVQHADGTVTVESATFADNAVSKGEGKLRAGLASVGEAEVSAR